MTFFPTKDSFILMHFFAGITHNMLCMKQQVFNALFAQLTLHYKMEYILFLIGIDYNTLATYVQLVLWLAFAICELKWKQNSSLTIILLE